MPEVPSTLEVVARRKSVLRDQCEPPNRTSHRVLRAKNTAVHGYTIRPVTAASTHASMEAIIGWYP